MSWHVSAELVSRYADGTLPDAAAWSVETHMTACGDCRASLGAAPTATDDPGVDDERLGEVWSAVAAGVRARQRPLLERALVRAGVADHDARLLVATPSLTASWLLGVVVVLGLSVAAAWATRTQGSQALLLFLLLAPIVPVAGVGVAFGPGVDPAYALAVVAPMRSARLLLLRSVAVLVSSLLLAAAGALALPVTTGWLAAAWILPSLALTAAVLAASARWHPLGAGAVIGAAWVVLVVSVEAQATGSLVAFGTAGQAAMAALLVLSLLVLSATRDRLDPAARA